MPRGKKRQQPKAPAAEPANETDEQEDEPVVPENLVEMDSEEVLSVAGRVEDQSTNLLLAMIADLKAQVEAVAKAQAPAVPNPTHGAPAVPRRDRPHILVWVNPWNCVRIEVAEDYTGPGSDGTPVKGFQNHENTLGNLGRR